MRPWLGTAAFSTLADAGPARLVPETREEAFWRKVVPSIFAPSDPKSLFGRLVLHVTVAPMAFVTLFNLHYQIYLSQLLHTSPLAWLGHAVCVPANVALLFYGLAVFAPVPDLFPGANAGLLLAAVLSAWYLGMAAKLRSVLWGVAACTVVVALFFTGNALARFAVDSARTGSARTSWYFHPVLLMGVVSSIQSLVHLFERMVPPRANHTDGWMTTREFLWGDGARLPLWKRLAKFSWLPVGAFWGAFDEWWSSAKLLPLFLLQTLWALGYKPEQQREFRARTLEVLRLGNPAMDWVGTGGGASVRELEREPIANDALTR